MADWNRYRFKADADDYRPIEFPPSGPYWCSGYGEDCSIIIAYAKSESEILKFWPEARDIDETHTAVDIQFTDRFPQPAWWVG